MGLAIDSRFTSDLGVPHHVEIDVAIGPPLKKTIINNSDRLRSSADLIGRAPVVVLSPDDKTITAGPYKYYDANAFMVPPNGTYGDAGANAFGGSWIRSFDLSFAKKIPLTERLSIQFRSELLTNILNHTNFNSPIQLCLRRPRAVPPRQRA